MTTDSVGRAFITHEEGEVLHQYRCKAGKLTIGVGHTGPDVTPGLVITHERSQALLSQDLARFEKAVRSQVHVDLTQNQFNALVSFAFNLGEGALAQSSLLKLVNLGDHNVADVTHAFEIWNKVKDPKTGEKKVSADILARRRREAKLFFTA